MTERKTPKKQAAEPVDVESPADQPVELVDSCMAPLAVTPDDDDADRVKVLQSFLAGAGHYEYEIDGVYGPRTLQGVQQVQRQLRGEGFTVEAIDGVYDDDVRAALCIALGTPAP